MSRIRGKRERRTKNDAYEREMHRRWDKFHNGVCPHCLSPIPKFTPRDRRNTGIHLTGDCLIFMAYKVTVEIYMSEVEKDLVLANELNIPMICCEAVKDKLDAMNTLRIAVHSATSSYAEVIQLRAENARLQGALTARKVPPLPITVLSDDKFVTVSPAQTIAQRALKAEGVIHAKKLLTMNDLYE